MRVVFFVTVGTILALCAQAPLLGQKVAGNAQSAAVRVPFVGCRSDGQTGPVGAPENSGAPVLASPKVAQEFAYYRSAQGIGVLGPRGCHCFGVYGSNGAVLYVTPEPIDTKNIFSSTRPKFSGPAIQVTSQVGDTSGRFDVAAIVARVFPAYRSFVTGVIEGFSQPASSFPSGPYPTDSLTYKGNRVVEYRTPAHTEGLGTHSWLEKNAAPIDGVAILVGPTPDLLLLAVRLPPNLSDLTSAVIQQFERDAASTPQD
jgi:hypothetical protein